MFGAVAKGRRMIAEITTALSTVTALSNQVQQLGPLVAKLRDKPDAAAEKVAVALDEIRKTCDVVDATLVKFLLLAEQPTYERLLELQDRTLAAHVEINRGHCTTMTELFRRYVDNWINRALDPADTNMARGVFASFEQADTDVFDTLTRAVGAVQSEATSLTKQYLLTGPGDVVAAVRTHAPYVLDLRLAIVRMLVTLVREQWAFRDISGVASR